MPPLPAMQGTLFKYGPGAAHVAFKSQPPAHGVAPAPARAVVLLGGLTDGLLFAPYAPHLERAAARLGWTLVQAQLSSSCAGWGLASLDADADELRLLSDCLRTRHGVAAWVLVGHSTGCQDAVRYVQRHRAHDDALAGVVLQAPVSDREYLGMTPGWAELEAPARAMVAAGRGDEVLCRARDWDGAAVSAARFLSLWARGGDDDCFSTDLTLEELRRILGPLRGLPCAIIQSGEDETVPPALRESGAAAALGRRMAEAIALGPPGAGPAEPGMPAARLFVVEGAGHACAGHEADVVAHISDFLEAIAPP
ncbi:SPAPB24D3.06c [Scenedesmus sp. PABB004]|nr:SPAPB24D3.06c [Scenedesmus sp. PABB004]